MVDLVPGKPLLTVVRDYTAKELALMLGIQEQSVRHRIRNLGIEGRREGRMFLYTYGEALRILAHPARGESRKSTLRQCQRCARSFTASYSRNGAGKIRNSRARYCEHCRFENVGRPPKRAIIGTPSA